MERKYQHQAVDGCRVLNLSQLTVIIHKDKMLGGQGTYLTWQILSDMSISADGLHYINPNVEPRL